MTSLQYFTSGNWPFSQYCETLTAKPKVTMKSKHKILGNPKVDTELSVHMVFFVPYCQYIPCILKWY